MRAKLGRRWLWMGVAAATVYWGMQAAGAQRPVTASSAQATAQADFLLTAWQATGAAVSGYEIHLWQPVSQDPASDEAMATVIDTIRQEFRLSDEKYRQVRSGGERLIELSGTWFDGTQVTAILSAWDAPTNSARTVLVVRAENQAGSTGHFAADLATIHAVSQELPAAAPSEISACLKGYVDDRIVGVAADRLVSGAFRAVAATRVEGMSTATETSISGYSARESTYIITNGRRMNIQVAVHPDTYHHRTNLLIGTPIITSAY